MLRLTNKLLFNVRKLKNIPSQSWIQKPKDASTKWNDADLSHLNIKYYKDLKYEKNASKKAIQNQEQINIKLENNCRPLSPIMGPITVQNPKLHDKIYRWCSCGLSLKQPFCDGSHDGTKFKPYKFTVEQSTRTMKLCGCKLTKNKPFCDGQSCKCSETQNQ